MKIANVDELQNGLNEVFAGTQKYFICKNGAKIKIYSSICPHQGAILCADSSNHNEIYCKVHNWRFDSNGGKAINVENARLGEVAFEIDTAGNICIDSTTESRLVSASLTTNPPPIAKTRRI